MLVKRQSLRADALSLTLADALLPRDQLVEALEGLIELSLCASSQQVAFAREFPRELITLAMQVVELLLDLVPAIVQHVLPTSALLAVGEELLLERFETAQPAIQLEVLTTEEGAGPVQDRSGDAAASGDLERP